MRQVAPRWSEKKGFERERKVIQKCMNISLTFGKKRGAGEVKVLLPYVTWCKIRENVGFEIS